MCGTNETRTLLPLASAAPHACSCCSPAVETQDAVRADAPSGSRAEASGPQYDVGTQYDVEGLTCGHCVQTVERAVAGVAGVESAAVTLVPGGTSQLTIRGNAQREALADAVRSSGYILAGAVK